MPTVFPSNSPIASMAGAYALMPVENFVQRAEARKQNLLRKQYSLSLKEQEAKEVAAQEQQFQETLNLFNKLDVLEPDRAKIFNQVRKPIYDEVTKLIKEKYNGNPQDFFRFEAPSMMARLRSEIPGNPLIQRGISNKANYLSFTESNQKGRLLTSQSRKAFEDWKSGKSDTLSFGGDYEAPKGILDFADKEHPLYPEGIISKDKKTGRRTAQPVEATRADLIKSAIDRGMTPENAADYVSTYLRLKDDNSRTGIFYKMKQQSSWDAENQAYQRQQDFISNRFRAKADARAERAEQRSVESHAVEMANKTGNQPHPYDQFTAGLDDKFDMAPVQRIGKANYKELPGTLTNPAIRDAFLQAAGIETSNRKMYDTIAQAEQIVPEYKIKSGFFIDATNGKRLNVRGGKIGFTPNNLNNLTQFHVSENGQAKDYWGFTGKAKFNGQEIEVIVPIDRTNEQAYIQLRDSFDSALQTSENRESKLFNTPLKAMRNDLGYLDEKY